MARVAQSFRVRVVEQEVGPIRNGEHAVQLALQKVGMTPHPKYYGRVRKIRARGVAPKRIYQFEVTRP